MSSEIPWQALRDHLEALGRTVRGTFLEIRRSKSKRVLASVHAETAADTIYAIDEAVETAIIAWLDSHWDQAHPVALIMEGLEAPLTLPRKARQPPGLTLIIDPIDGTREIMWDRRSAWFLGGLAAHDTGRQPRLADVKVAVMVELPTTLQRGSFLLSVGPERAPKAEFLEFATDTSETVDLKPFAGEALAHGFISIGTPFFEGRTRISVFAEAFIARYFEQPLHRLPIFDDQYVSSGGQLFELISGRLRLVADLRPLFLEVKESASGLCAHPYDVCTAAVAQAFGCLVEGPDGEPLNPPLDTTTGVAWIGYANVQIAKRARPIVQALLPAL